jgi:hypothetical protein
LVVAKFEGRGIYAASTSLAIDALKRAEAPALCKLHYRIFLLLSARQRLLWWARF